MNNLRLLLAFILIPLISTAQKRSREVKADLKHVVVYNSSAEMNYEKEILIYPGKNVITFTDLTTHIAENTINISVSSPEVDIITVTDRIDYIKEKKVNNKKVKELREEVKAIELERGLLSCKIDAYTSERNLLFAGESIGGVSEGVAVDEIIKASNFYQERYYKLTSELFHLQNEAEELVRKARRIGRHIEALSEVVSVHTSEIEITVMSAVLKKTMFKFKFLTTQGGWAPVYDFKYEGPGKPLGFMFRANVFNASGTPWTNVNLKLSTATPIKGFDVPQLEDRRLNKKVSHVPKVAFKQIEVVNAITTYDIQHRYTIPSDAKPYLVDVDAYSMPAEFNYLMIPRLDPFGFLMAKLPNWNHYNLIPGDANIYNLGTYMGKTFLNTYAANDTLSMFLGKDKILHAVREEENTEHPRNFIGNNFLDETKVKITIKSSSSDPISVEVWDQVPVVSAMDKYKLNLSGIGQADYNKAEGLLKWHFTAIPGEPTDINFKYSVKAPKEHYESYRARKRKFRSISCPTF